MKKIIIIVLVMLTHNYIFAQGEAPVQAELNSIFANIDKSQIPSGYLAEYGSNFIQKTN